MGLWRSFGRRGAPLSSSGSLQADAGEEGGFGIVPGIERGGIERGGSEAGWVGFLGLGDGAGGGAWSMARPTFSQRIARISSGVVFGSRARLVSRRS